jgi:hypothetical protein
MSLQPEGTVLSSRSLRVARRESCRRTRLWQRLGSQIALGLEWLAYHSPYSMLSGEELYLHDGLPPRSPSRDDRAPPDGGPPN